MAKSLSLTELTALYANKGKNPKALFEQETKTHLDTVLPGVSTVDKLNKLFFTRQNGLLPVRPKAWASEAEHNTIAICVVIVDSLHHEAIWREWVESSSTLHHTEDTIRYKAELFIHAKHPEKITSEWVRARLIDVTFRPEWNSVEVVQSLLSVLDAALQYTSTNTNVSNDTTPHTARVAASACPGACGRFLLATESCLPLYDLQTTGEMLFKDESSWLNAYHTPQGSWEAGTCFRAVDADVVPPKAVWKSLPGWVLLTRLHALEIVTLTDMLGGWGQQKQQQQEGGVYSYMCDPAYVSSYQGTKATRWRESGVEGRVDSTADVSDATTVAVADTTSTTIPAPTQSALLLAWGAGGRWHERNGSVFAPEEMFFPTALSLLGYLRESSSGVGGSGSADRVDTNGVRIAMVTFAEWQKKGDANPIQYDHFDAQIVTRMRAGGAAFGRKFCKGSVDALEWRSVVKQVDREVSSSGGGGGGRVKSGGRDSRDRDERSNRNHNTGGDRRYSNQYNNRGEDRHNDRYNDNGGDRRNNKQYNNRSDDRLSDGYNDNGGGQYNRGSDRHDRDNNYNNRYEYYNMHNHSNNSGGGRYDESRDRGRDGESDYKRRRY